MTKATEASRVEMLDQHRKAIDGVIQVIAALQDLPDEIRYLRNRIMSNLLWVVTEYKPVTKHKIHGVRWRTPDAHALVVARETKTVRHEHIIERRWMVEFLNLHAEAVDSALWNYPACLVTVPEHAALRQSTHWGWRRYVDVGLQVIDAVTGDELDLISADEDLRERFASLGAEID